MSPWLPVKRKGRSWRSQPRLKIRTLFLMYLSQHGHYRRNVIVGQNCTNLFGQVFRHDSKRKFRLERLEQSAHETDQAQSNCHGMMSTGGITTPTIFMPAKFLLPLSHALTTS